MVPLCGATSLLVDLSYENTANFCIAPMGNLPDPNAQKTPTQEQVGEQLKASGITPEQIEDALKASGMTPKEIQEALKNLRAVTGNSAA